MLRALASWRSRAMATSSISAPFRLLLCGDESAFPDGVRYTKECLRPYSNIQVDALSFQDVEQKIQDYDMCVVRMMKLDASLISRARRMKLICQFGVGLEGVNMHAATKAGIRVGRIPSAGTGNALSCAEHAIYLMLALLRDQKGMDESIRTGMLGRPTGVTLFRKTVLIVGYGNIGRELAMRLRLFGVRILATKRSWNKKSEATSTRPVSDRFVTENSDPLFQYLKENEDLLVDEKGTPDSVHEFASRADIVVLCCLQTPETAGMVNEKFVASLKKGAFIVNIARGGLLDYNAVKNGLESGRIGGLGIDVAWSEPIDPEDSLVHHPKVVVTPHIAGVTEMSYRSMAKVIADCAVALSNGQDVSGLELVN